MLGKLLSVLTGGGFKSIERIASEWIETDMECAEAKVLKIKALDPNGMMRRGQSTMMLRLYAFYIFSITALIALEFFGFGSDGAAIATDKLKDLFMPITALVGVIIHASFGVNKQNAKMGK